MIIAANANVFEEISHIDIFTVEEIPEKCRKIINTIYFYFISYLFSHSSSHDHLQHVNRMGRSPEFSLKMAPPYNCDQTASWSIIHRLYTAAFETDFERNAKTSQNPRQ